MKCESCGKDHDGKYASGRFCDYSCSRSFATKAKQVRNNCKNCGKLGTTRRQKQFCSQQCSADYRYKRMLNDWKSGQDDGVRALGQICSVIRRYFFEKYDSKCSKCGWSVINQYTNRIPLEINHIDGNWKNNKEENLELICCNCHALTSNFRARNKGNGRKSITVYNE